ncbi:hypothetical protein [Spirosoma rhododendri]|uniref:Outer membrane protein beta-barrel domain-containing protein n=1 Tax=Spirosoma rhododendri TaxID=2728024 RepID=A0A7L5DP44_9BACT|nr:hypothetical protein [Spirosoma rhododendri]QJD80264.1 hypothetical protein HH216_18945 [Spirosoma rhododendri]
MKKFLLAVCLLGTVTSFAQSPVSARLSSGYDLGMGYSTNRYNPSIQYYQLLNIGERKLVSLGWNFRLGAFYGDNIDCYTAPARLTREKTGFSALGAPLVPANIDTLRFDFVSMTSASIGVRAQINLGRVELGASADLVGLTLGRTRTGRVTSSTGRYRVDSTTTSPFTGANADQSARPSRLNARLLGDNNLGTLSTDVYARIRVSQRVGIKVGYQWLTSEVRMSNRDVIADNDRFRNRSGLAYLAVTLPIFQ